MTVAMSDDILKDLNEDFDGFFRQSKVENLYDDPDFPMIREYEPHPLFRSFSMENHSHGVVPEIFPELSTGNELGPRCSSHGNPRHHTEVKQTPNIKNEKETMQRYPLTPDAQSFRKRKVKSWTPDKFKASCIEARRTKSLKNFSVSMDSISINDKSRGVSNRGLVRRKYNKVGLESAPKQRRVKWSDEEIRSLWVGIKEHGNEWREIQDALPKRTYHQVKDKGRRLLQQEFWKTGRSKLQADGACGVAKEIAASVLKRLSKSET